MRRKDFLPLSVIGGDILAASKIAEGFSAQPPRPRRLGGEWRSNEEIIFMLESAPTHRGLRNSSKE